MIEQNVIYLDLDLVDYMTLINHLGTIEIVT